MTGRSKLCIVALKMKDQFAFVPMFGGADGKERVVELPDTIPWPAVDFFCAMYAGLDVRKALVHSTCDSPQKKIVLFAQACDVASRIPCDDGKIKAIFFDMFCHAATAAVGSARDFGLGSLLDLLESDHVQLHVPAADSISRVSSLLISEAAHSEAVIAIFPLMLHEKLLPATVEQARALFCAPGADCFTGLVPHILETLYLTSDDTTLPFSLETFVRHILLGKAIDLSETLNWPWGMLFGTDHGGNPVEMMARASRKIVCSEFFKSILAEMGETRPVTSEEISKSALRVNELLEKIPVCEIINDTAFRTAAFDRFQAAHPLLFDSDNVANIEWLFQIFSPFMHVQSNMLHGIN